MPVSMTPYRVFPDYRHIDPAFFTRHGIRLLLCDLDYTLAPKSQPEPDDALRRWLSEVQAAGVTVMILSNTFNIVMAVFDVSQQVIQQSAGLIQGSTAVTPDVLNDMQTQLEAMELGPLLGIFLQSFFVQFTMTALNIVIFVIVYGRMIEIYLMTSLAPIPFATSVNREVGHMGHNYFKSLFAVGFQGMLIMVCVAIYAVLVQSIVTDGDMMNAIWTCVGYTVLLCFVLFKTGSLSKSIFGAH